MPPRPLYLALALGLSAAAAAQEAPRSVVLQADAGGRMSTSQSTGVGQRYFTDYTGNAVVRSNPDGSGVTTVVPDVNTPYGIAFDADAQQLLWTSSSDEVVQAAAADGGGLVTLDSAFEENFVLVVESEGVQTAYFVDGAELVKLELDATTGAERRTVLLSLPAEDSVHGLALSPARDVLYLGDANGMMSQRLRLADNDVSSLEYVDEPAPPEPQPWPDPEPWPGPGPEPIPVAEPEGVR